MTRANLLVEKTCFRWSKNSDLTELIENFQIMFQEAKSDNIFNMPELWTLQHVDGRFIIDQIIAIQKEAQVEFPWLLPQHRQFFVQNIMYRGTSPRQSGTFDELSEEFPSQNNGLLHIGRVVLPNCVFNLESWHELHLRFRIKHFEFIPWHNHPFLPNLNFSLEFLASEYTKATGKNAMAAEEVGQFFYDEVVKKLPKGQGGEGEMIRLAREIARRNYYEEDFELSSKEQQRRGSLRKIFRVKKDELWQYLSLDFEKCAFEVCDHNGRHQGEFRFDGQENGRNTKDPSGKHDIWVLKRV